MRTGSIFFICRLVALTISDAAGPDAPMWRRKTPASRRLPFVQLEATARPMGRRRARESLRSAADGAASFSLRRCSLDARKRTYAPMSLPSSSRANALKMGEAASAHSLGKSVRRSDATLPAASWTKSEKARWSSECWTTVVDSPSSLLRSSSELGMNWAKQSSRVETRLERSRRTAWSSTEASSGSSSMMRSSSPTMRPSFT
mmetsp:Transcript_37873/g.91304  ORF Transcript_37873/g.91304 Transcript_37873/m.91304 type:complete len:203 (+) Transcript_37873:1340-1948(+)